MTTAADPVSNPYAIARALQVICIGKESELAENPAGGDPVEVWTKVYAQPGEYIDITGWAHPQSYVERGVIALVSPEEAQRQIDAGTIKQTATSRAAVTPTPAEAPAEDPPAAPQDAADDQDDDQGTDAPSEPQTAAEEPEADDQPAPAKKAPAKRKAAARKAPAKKKA